MDKTEDYEKISESTSTEKLIKLRDVALDYREEKHREYLAACDRVAEIFVEIHKRHRFSPE